VRAVLVEIKMAIIQAHPRPRGKIKRAFVWTFKPFINFTEMLGFSALKHTFKDITHDVKLVASTPEAGAPDENFEQAAKRLRLSEKAIARKAADFLRLALVFAMMGIVILLYAMSLGWRGDLSTFVLAFAVSLLAFGYAFRFHFWYFQVKSRKLGCTLHDWYHSSFKGSKP
jgi:intracellular multiplication protein IcmV